MKTNYCCGLAIVVALAGAATPALADREGDRDRQGDRAPVVMPPASQLEEEGRITRVQEEISTLWIDGRKFRISRSTDAYVDGARLSRLSQVKVGQRAAFQSSPDGQLGILVLSSDD